MGRGRGAALITLGSLFRLILHLYYAWLLSPRVLISVFLGRDLSSKDGTNLTEETAYSDSNRGESVRALDDIS